MSQRIIISVLITTLLLGSSCKINRLNHGLKTGLWKTVHQSEPFVYKSRGRFKNGRETGTWKFYLDGKLYKKEKYTGMSAQVWFYYPDKKVASTGRTHLDITPRLTHWYYTGEWKFYSPEAKLVEIKTYEKGKEVKSELINP